MNRAELREDVRSLIGAGAFDRSFKPEWANEAIAVACAQVASKMGLTRVESHFLVTNKRVTLSSDVVSVDSVRIGDPPVAITAPATCALVGPPDYVSPNPIVASIPDIGDVTCYWTVVDENDPPKSFSFSGDGSRSITLTEVPGQYAITFSCEVYIGPEKMVAIPARMLVTW